MRINNRDELEAARVELRTVCDRLLERGLVGDEKGASIFLERGMAIGQAIHDYRERGGDVG